MEPEKKYKTLFVYTIMDLIIKKKHLYYLIGIIIVVILLFFFTKLNSPKQTVYRLDGDTLFYSPNRETPKFNQDYFYTNESIDVYKINFMSRNFSTYEARIYGLLFLPKTETKENKVSGVVLLPGGGGSKEGETRLALIIANFGYAVLTIDQRGIGQTEGYYLNPNQDFTVFSKGIEPIQHLSVYDALLSYDVLKSIDGVDPKNIALVGESMGARYATIATAIDLSIKGNIAISSAGFHIPQNLPPSEQNYYNSIDVDNYVDKISPRPIYMLHGSNDTVIPLKDARETFALAKEPKKFFVAQNCQHGYCEAMYDELKNDLKEIFMG
ncbi:hypothetical protein COU57_06965 [Candidatus Pacearchaeota archaeon CG10_big_fil_rev_8_21_14_0_10_32_14]|nr:MAG: hypothetical protein COU57_06965 [Candidatus Pacearchaeota archaeon CG10_big_fil_rev_8_21_14_0_10_32_14]